MDNLRTWDLLPKIGTADDLVLALAQKRSRLLDQYATLVDIDDAIGEAAAALPGLNRLSDRLAEVESAILALNCSTPAGLIAQLDLLRDPGLFADCANEKVVEIVILGLRRMSRLKDHWRTRC